MPKDSKMTTSTTSIVGADAPPTPRAADRQIKARCSENLPDRRKNAVLELDFAPLLASRDVISAPASNFVLAGSEVHHVAA